MKKFIFFILGFGLFIIAVALLLQTNASNSYSLSFSQQISQTRIDMKK